MESVRSLLKKTFSTRRNDILNNVATIKESLVQYPFFSGPDCVSFKYIIINNKFKFSLCMQLLFELDLVLAKTRNYKQLWREMVPKIIQLGKQEVRNSNIQNVLAEADKHLSAGK